MIFLPMEEMTRKAILLEMYRQGTMLVIDTEHFHASSEEYERHHTKLQHLLIGTFERKQKAIEEHWKRWEDTGLSGFRLEDDALIYEDTWWVRLAEDLRLLLDDMELTQKGDQL